MSETAAGAKFGPPDYEVKLLYLACLAALLMGGSGPFAVDGLIAKRGETRTIGATELPGARTQARAP